MLGKKTNKQVKADQKKTYHREWRRKGIGLGPHGSSTAGSVKIDRCQASGLDKWMAKHNRSYKHPDYPAWSAAHRAK